SITSAMSKMSEKEALMVQVIISPASNRWRHQARAFLSGLENNVDEKGKPKVSIDPAIPPAVEQKSSKVGFTTAIRLMSIAPTTTRAKANLKNVINAYDQFTLPHLGGLKKTKVYFKKWFVHDFVYKYMPLFRYKMVLNIEELAT